PKPPSLRSSASFAELLPPLRTASISAASSSTNTSTTGTLPFTVNERVLCYHGPLIY
ncbi:hypothetical protein EV363DRAFT_1094362, partial [Boletus edulis]